MLYILRYHLILIFHTVQIYTYILNIDESNSE